jgi:hypothetical protein
MMYALDRLLLINLNKERCMHLFDAVDGASPFQKKISSHSAPFALLVLVYLVKITNAAPRQITVGL